ncbi:GTP-binding protein SAR1 [Hypoxylon fuscum]|nr:GTP-binding protein SAR1 [Hypoxylon fuscum]
MWITDKLYGSLTWLGLLNNKRAKILFLGLDNAGKSTLLLRLKSDHQDPLEPTLYPTTQELRIGRLRCTAFDLGGHQQARQLWRNYFPEANGVVFLVDSADEARFAEAKAELDQLLIMKELWSVPILVLGTKTDNPQAVQETELYRQLGLHAHVMHRPIELFMCSTTEKKGYTEGFCWLTKYI